MEKFYLLDAAQRLFYDLPTPSAPVMEGAYCYLPEIWKNSKKKKGCKQYAGFSNWMSAVEETSSKHIKSVVILSLNTLFS